MPLVPAFMWKLNYTKYKETRADQQRSSECT